MLYRSRRLETLFGGPLDTVTYAALAALVNNSEAAEAEDLDYKREMLAADDKGKEELAKDVAALANHIGGIIVVGMADTKGLPAKVMDSDVSDAHQRHLQQVVASNTAPPVRFETRAVHNPENPGQGFLIVSVPRSPQGPHAVTSPPVKATEKALRYPRRTASKTDWLTETDVATAYHRRFSAAADRGGRLQDIEHEQLAGLPASNVAHLLVSVTPEIPGDMQITQALYNRHKYDLLATATFLGEDDPLFTEVRVGSRRLIAQGGDPGGYWYNRCELHRDGSGSTAMRMGSRTDTEQMVDFGWAEPDTVVYELLSALYLLGSHARDRAGATGTALIKAALVDAPHSHPLGPPKPAMTPFLPFRIDRVNPITDRRTALSAQFCPYADSDAAALLDDLADGGTGLVQAASMLADELFHAFGIAEATQITRNGEIRSSAWSSYLKPRILHWAQNHGITVLSE